MAPIKKPGHSLKVSVGPNPSQLNPMTINNDANPVWIESEEFVGQVVVRIKTQQSHKKANGDEKSAAEDSPWFDMPGGANNICSIQILGRFKQEWPGDQVVFGDQFDRPLKVPPLASTAMKFIHMVNPGLETDITCAKPWAFSPLIAAMNTVHVSKWVNENTVNGLPPWPSKAGEHTSEDTSLLFEINKAIQPMNSSQRRSYFTKASNLQRHIFSPDHVYSLDFFNQFLDLGTFKVKIPGLTIDLSRPLDNQPLQDDSNSLSEGL
ncbi:hypothetical protein BGZ94_009160 [Podila epigama]|nr:hypothetical protein BGZ94_009160 [Podila epigama]